MNESFKLDKGDVIKSLGEISKITEDFFVINDKRHSKKKTLETLTINDIIFKVTPNIKLDWTNKEEVLGFYSSFKRWSFYISGGCKYTTELCEVKDGMLCHNGEYYLPAPRASADDWCTKDVSEIKDGLYYVKLYKRPSGYYSTMGGEIMNVFYIAEATSKEEQEFLQVRKNWDYYNTPVEQNVEHIKKIDLQKILGKELDYIKSNMYEFFKEHLPFKASNGVFINKWESFKNPLVCSRGLLYIDNSYRGPFPSGLDYGLMLNFHPSFSNESKYYASCYVKEFSLASLEQISVGIKKSVESYCKL